MSEERERERERERDVRMYVPRELHDAAYGILVDLKTRNAIRQRGLKHERWGVHMQEGLAQNSHDCPDGGGTEAQKD